jgi:L-fuconolactonase
MPVIDAHSHFWKFNPVRDGWITREMDLIRRDFFPHDLQVLLRQHGINGCVAVQSDQSEQENSFHLMLAAQHDFIKGVVGWIDLQDPDVERRLAFYQSYPLMKGFRHVLQSEKDRALMLSPGFLKGISLLQKYGFTYDLLILPDQLGYAKALSAEYPEQKFVLDHIGKPDIGKGEIHHWRKAIKALSLNPNVYCKISGMVTEADWQHWSYVDFIPYLDTVVAAFGMQRIMYGSDWPVNELAGGYSRMHKIVKEYFEGFSTQEQEAFWGGNASSFYNLTTANGSAATK